MKDQLNEAYKQLEAANKKIGALSAKKPMVKPSDAAGDSDAASKMNDLNDEIHDLQKKLLGALGEAEQARKNLDNAKRDLKDKDDLIEKIKQDMEIHVEKKIIKNTTTVETHVNRL